MPKPAQQPAAIGVYDGELCNAFHIEPALRCMQLPYEVFGDEDVLRPGFGDDLSLLIFGAGHVSESPTALGGSRGRQRIRDLILGGIDYMGICAGAYLALFDEPLGLGLAHHQLDYPQTANTFQGFLTVEWPPGSAERFPVWHQNGPVFSRDVAGALARFTHEEPSPAMTCSRTALLTAADFADRPAAIMDHFGKGRCILLSPHLELGTLGMPGFASLVHNWMAEHAPEELKTHPNQVPMGRVRQRFVEDVPTFGLHEHLDGPQWRTFRRLLMGQW